MSGATTEGFTSQDWFETLVQKRIPQQSREENLREWPYRVHLYEFKTLKDAIAFAGPINAYIYDRRSGHVVCTEEENS